MKNLFSKAFATAALGLLAGNASAQTVAPVSAEPAPAAGSCWDCNSQRCGPNFYSSWGLLFLKRGGDNPAYSAYDCTYQNAIVVNHFTTYQNYDGAKDIAFRGEFGISNSCGLGARGRWFRYSSDNSTTLVDNDAGNVTGAADGQVIDYTSASPLNLNIISQGNGLNPSVFSTSERVRIQMYDLEVTKAINVSHFDLLFSGGVRFAHISQDYSAVDTLTNAPDQPQFQPIQKILISGHNLNAFGPTVAIEGRVPLSCNFRLYGLNRWSFLCAKGRHTVGVLQLPDPNLTAEFLPPTAPQFGATATRNTVLPIGEVEIGGEYSMALGSSELFLRGGLYGASFFNAGNSSRSAPTGSQANDTLGLYGIALSAGLRY